MQYLGKYEHVGSLLDRDTPYVTYENHKGRKEVTIGFTAIAIRNLGRTGPMPKPISVVIRTHDMSIVKYEMGAIYLMKQGLVFMINKEEVLKHVVLKAF